MVPTQCFDGIVVAVGGGTNLQIFTSSIGRSAVNIKPALCTGHLLTHGDGVGGREG